MTYKGFEIEVSPEDLKKKNILYGWLIKTKDKEDFTYYGISTRTLEIRTKEHIDRNKMKFDKFLTDNKDNIVSIELKVEKQYKRNFKNMLKRLQKLETARIAKRVFESAINLNVKTC